MGFTMAEKILARASGRKAVRAGEEVQARPDFVLAYEFPGYTDQFFRMMAEDFGRDALDAPERFAIFIDHMVPSSTPAALRTPCSGASPPSASAPTSSTRSSGGRGAASSSSAP